MARNEAPADLLVQTIDLLLEHSDLGAARGRGASRTGQVLLAGFDECGPATRLDEALQTRCVGCSTSVPATPPPCPAGRRCGGARGRARSQRQYASMPQGRRLFESVNVTVNFSSNVRPDYVRNQSGAVLRERVTMLRVLHLTKEPANCGVTHKSNRRKKS